MADEPDTLADAAGTDNVNPSDTDNAESWDYFDPDEDQDTEEAPVDEVTDDEADETEEQPEEDSEETSEDQSEDEAPEAPETARVRLADGTTATVAELVQGNMRQADYTRKAQEVATRRKTLEADASRISDITQTFVDHLASLLPAEPDPQLVYSDPVKFSQQKAIYDQSLAQVQKLIELGGKPKEITDGIKAEDKKALVQQENMRLVEMFPETGTQEGREKFFGSVQQVANELGFTNEELSNSTDHRLFALAHWAKKGMEAEKARAKAKAKVQKAPPAPPNKPGGQRQSGNRDAMAKLRRSGSIRDALAVDWD